VIGQILIVRLLSRKITEKKCRIRNVNGYFERRHGSLF
jgi:hypothetical protein